MQSKTRRSEKHGKGSALRLLLLIGLLVLVETPAARADGTAAGTAISNQATVNYQVGGVAQTTVLSDDPAVPGFQATAFVVDRTIDLMVEEAGGGYTDVSPGASAQVVTFTVANTGNATLDFDLSGVVNLVNGAMGPFGDADTLDVTVVDAFVDSDGPGPTDGGAPYNSSAHTYSAGSDTATSIDDLPQDQMINVYVVVTIPGSAVNGDIAGISLTALARETDGGEIVQTSGADTVNAVDTVFADGAGDTDGNRDGQYSATDAFRVVSAALTVTKTSVVVEDPVNGTSNPKAIPGAFIEYTITVSNAGTAGAQAANVTITDNLGSEIGNGTLAFRTNSYVDPGYGLRVTAPGINGGAATDLSNAGGDDQGDFGASTADTVTVNCGTLDIGQSAVITFQVVVQ